MKQSPKSAVTKKSTTPFDYIPITSTFDETYCSFQDNQKLNEGAQASVYKVVRKNDDESKIFAAKKFHKNVRDVFQREKIAY